MASAMAQALLDEISSESLQHLLSSVRVETSHPGSTNIAALDAHFFATAQHQSAPGSSLNLGDVIEIQGPPASGKTHLLYHLLINCLIPSNLQGWAKAGVVLDTDGCFDILRLKQLLMNRLISQSSSSSGVDSTENIKNTMFLCLNNLHIFRVTSSAQLAATLLRLPDYHSHCFPDSEIGLLAIDSISSFYWPDRFTTETHQSAPSGSQRATNPFQYVLHALHKIHGTHRPVMVLTNWGLSQLTSKHVSDSTPVFYRQHLQLFPAPFSRKLSDPLATHAFQVTHHITMSVMNDPTRYSVLTKQSELTEDGKSRHAKCPERDLFVGSVRTPGSSRLGRFVLQIN